MTNFNLEAFITDVPDFPKAGIIFKDITPLLADAGALKHSCESLAQRFAGDGVDVVAGAESRGFMFGVGVGMALGVGFVPIRKPGKLPRDTHRVTYELEYGSDTLEIHRDAIKPGQRVLLVDDLLATGGTMKASIELVKKCGAEVVGCAFVIELGFLKGRDVLMPYPVHSLINYDSE